MIRTLRRWWRRRHPKVVTVTIKADTTKAVAAFKRTAEACRGASNAE